ncbi:MAG TPA: enoyl-CoA hydratase-related protein [Sphingomonas sp.]|nr:enoyl-CoA hydratase-related protein [Sphingomonas sp.]
MDTGAVITARDGAVGIVRLCREDKLNALDLAARKALACAFEELAADDAIRVIIVTGGKKVFAAGADLALLAGKGSGAIRALDLLGYWRPVAECTKPVIAAVSGYALGAGCELALMCDIIIADSSAQFGLPESRVGIMPGAGGTQRLVRVLGKHVTSHLLMTGGTLDAGRAYALGLVCELAQDGGTEALALEHAKRIARQPPLALQAIKRALAVGADLPLTAANALENREFLLLFDSDDAQEGIAAFLEKRRPLFKGV